MPTTTDAPRTDDRALALRAGAGDPDALAELHRRHDARLRRIARRILRDPDEAQDAAQEAWIRASGRIGRAHDPAAWLAAVARNEALRMLADRARRPVPLGTLPEGADGTADPARRLEAAETTRALRSAVAALPHPYREAALRELAGQRPAEIADALGIAPGAARVRGHRARRMMAAELAGAGLAA